jgi:hypothetical protein
MKTLISAIAFFSAVYLGWNQLNEFDLAVYAAPGHEAGAIASAKQQRGEWITGKGTVVKILPDDNKGSRHQRFILKLATGQTVLVAHNIDVAPRIDSLAVGDVVEFKGEYVWNPKGGVVHWTHRDPQKRHEGGWLKHVGRVYQ